MGGVLFALLLSIVFPLSLFAGAHFTEVNSSGDVYVRSWARAEVQWRLRSSGAPAGAREIIERSFQAWSEGSSAQVSAVYAGESDVSLPTQDGFSDFIFDIPFSRLGLSSDLIAITVINGDSRELSFGSRTSRIQEADILLNPELAGDWVTGTPTLTTDLDLQEIITHEIGHLFGLAHSFLLDSMMFPAKPSVGLSQDYIALFRVPKREIASDDAAWLAKLYPTASFRNSTSEISGRILLDGKPFIGAHIVAYKNGEPDLELYQVGANQATADLVFKGMKNISAFSEADGRFAIPGLSEGTYGLLIQDGDSFLSFSLSRVNTFLDRFGSASVYPNQFFSTSAFSANSDGASAISVSAGASFCGLEINSGSPGTLPKASRGGQCSSGGGGCVIAPQARMNSLVLLMLAVASLGLFALRKRFPRISL